MLTFHQDTPEAVRAWLKTSNERRQRIRIFYGDRETGRDWLEEHDTRGIIGWSCGRVKAPLMIARRNSTGGTAILDHCILKITTKDSRGRIVTVYQVANYQQPAPVVVGTEVFINGNCQARFKTEGAAVRYAAFIRGERDAL